MSIKRPKPIAKPSYLGERVDRTSKVMRLCNRCDRLATHRALMFVRKGPLDVWFCEMHTQEEVKNKNLRRVRTLPEYRRYQSRLQRWHAQADAGNQEAML